MVLDWNRYLETARQVVAEGCVLLKNENHVLPFEKKEKIAVFGRIQRHYYKSGTGSGGMVNVSKVTGILDALMESDDVIVDEKLLAKYDEWEETNPFDEGIGWANEPWSQVEMPLDDEIVKTAKERNDAALIVIGRTAGEDRDNVDEKGAYRFSDLEVQMIEKVTSYFDKVVLVFNVGSIMDMSAECLNKCEAIVYAWQGGMVGGYGVADVLTGRVSPSGHLADTVACKISDYPSTANFGDLKRNIYEEDIYVGYRYFETVAKEKVLYPFGFGLSYTEFSEEVESFSEIDGNIEIKLNVKNVGKMSGKHVVQAYVEAPQGELGKPSRVLASYAKTCTLKPGEETVLNLSIREYDYASYDDKGATAFTYSYVLESGEYHVYAGANVRDAKLVGRFHIDQTKLVEKCSQQMAPTLSIRRMKPVHESNDRYNMTFEDVQAARAKEAEERKANLPSEITQTGDKGYKLRDVAEGRVTMEQFVAQMSDEDLSCIVRGEGMGSPKVTPGTAAAYGGVSESLAEFGIPCGCCSDGPSGMRLDCGIKAFSLPNGTLMACTFNSELVGELYTMTGLEMRNNQVDNLLGPGMNIHRNPLNGRNFEYFSEDPYLTGTMAIEQLKAFHKSGVTGTIKHFAGNNQEAKRMESDSVVSERALREIYLKGFEMAVREGGADSVMTTYGSLNGVWTAGRYELNTAILRDEWGFKGIVMTDWWASISSQGGPVSTNDFASMVRAQNDLYMVCPDGATNQTGDNTLAELKAGTLTRAELQRSAINICTQLCSMPAFSRLCGNEEQVEIVNRPVEADDFSLDDIVYYDILDDTVIPMEDISTDKDSNFVFAMNTEVQGIYEMEFVFQSELNPVAQIPVTLFTQSVPVGVITFNGTEGEWKSMKKKTFIATKYVVARLYFAQSGVKLKEIHFHLMEKAVVEGSTPEVTGQYDMSFR